MNICLITMEWPPYGCGIGTYMFNLARGLVEHGHRVTVITNDKQLLDSPGVKLVQVPVPDNKGTLWYKIQKWRMEPYHTWSKHVCKRFFELCENESFDIIETAEYGAWARHLVGRLNIPLVVRCHNPSHVVWSINQTANGSWQIPLWLRFQDILERRQTFHADAVVAPSYALANHLCLSWVIPRSRFTVLPNPIDAELFSTGDGENKENKEILYVGRLQFNKGSFDLAEAAVPLLKKYPELTIRFVGMDSRSPKQFRKHGPMCSNVIRSIIPEEYHSRVIFTNHVSVTEIISFQQDALCTVMPTRGFESFSYTVLESMSCGRPVIATHCGGPTEIITDGVDGLLVPVGEIKSLTGAMQKMIADPKLRQQLSTQARLTVQRKFAISVVVPKIVQFYEDVTMNYKNKKAITS